MKDYVKENQQILERWRTKFAEDKKSDEEYIDLDPAKYFAFDGLMNKGEFYVDKRDDIAPTEWTCRRRPCGIESELWANSPLRVLILGKDPNGYGCEAWDVRTETYYIKGKGIPPQNNEISESVFYQNAACALYGIFHTDLDRGIMNYNDITWEDALHFSDDLMFARVNCKKETGGPTCTPSVLNKAVREYFDFLSAQIKELDADIIICSGKSSIIHILNKIYNKSFVQVPEAQGAWYNEKENKLAIDCYHLSWNYGSVGDEVYNSILQPYFAFIQKHPNFIKSLRK